jgi:hypothetical protein
MGTFLCALLTLQTSLKGYLAKASVRGQGVTGLQLGLMIGESFEHEWS